jgi:hypothetical protein
VSDDPPLPKPGELLALGDVATGLFDQLRRWFEVPEQVALDLTAVDSAVTELGEPVMIAALAMRKLQALHLLATPGVRTTTDVLVTIVQDLDRALVQAPNMALRRQAESTDWDAELAQLDSGTHHPSIANDPTAPDPEVVAFREAHSRLHDAVRAVVEASEGRIRIFE